MKKYLTLVIISTLCGFAGAFLFGLIYSSAPVASDEFNIPVSRVEFPGTTVADNPDFVAASRSSTPCVVFIKTVSTVQMTSPWDDWFSWDMFGQRGQVSSSGSGVIISEDGYIVTNNHVIDGAESIEVVLNNNRYSYKATVVGTDPSTDLALLKIEASRLPIISFGNSDQLQIGEWVIAVGNPFNLTSTVTAGIVSAKGRNINVVNNNLPIESFIQTDAAINPGNSGGALVNQKGELVGINTAIATKTGAYNGYGFAIPANIVSKIVKDLIEFKEVQRAFTGLDAVDITADLLTKAGNEEKGVYVAYVSPDGAASRVDIREGDVILKANDREVNTRAAFDELIAYNRPGDKIRLLIQRAGQTSEKTIVLLNREGTKDMLRRSVISSASLAADFEVISKVERDRYKVGGGIKVSNIRNGVIRRMNIPDGFIFIKINNNEYSAAEPLIRDLERLKGRINIEGIHPNGTRQFLSYYYY